MTYAVIMAGGRGERFWPKSKQRCPKQFLRLVGDRTMLQKTASRLEMFLAPENIFVITARDYREIVLEQVPEIPEENLIFEPFGRDTAAAIGLGTIAVKKRDPAGVIVVLPADHYIADERRFCEVLEAAVGAASSGEHAVTIGIRPGRPETGFGYIARGERYRDFNGIPAYRVLGFTEKPDRERALQFLEKGNYLWNSGIFVWRADLIERLIEKHLPVLAAGLKEIEESWGTERCGTVLEKVYAGLPKISIDYGVMEKAEGVLVFPGDFGWDDVGSWTALESYKKKDGNGNILEGRGVLVDTENTLVQATSKVVATLGVKDLIVVEDEGSILICHKKKAQELKKVINALQENGYKEIL
ncbi:MAG: mannose-phosphate guanylyltransferase [Thermacetogenium sp.]|jgi:mannose-1-phosphate guanylyltransferase|uniref:mannose-1-phosphate guanylyltransferase n=1 Tax=Thermacetogenium phaeum TaxID=85874 RepID=A0A101FHD9_9THEO|nr:MAG: Mannose-1-phosphate guanylyltransferase ManC [Thermacetogenium phaeum]MDN5366133.1 mannose-phosphate guanylyltransferase [Thermacetogenium sp.]MDN5375670.1 mannose-phosphate guanylyltransferase [Thermacetogenium sp.]